MADNTLLVISGLDLPPHSARGLTQTYGFVESAKVLRRTIDGDLHDLSSAQFRKIVTNISCSDFRGPAFDGVNVGKQITIDCAFELSYKAPVEEEEELGDGAAHTIVSGSARLKDGYVFYRPQIVALITDFDFTRDEWQGITGWQLTAEEV